MSKVKSQDTKPEIAVRSALHRLGYRFRLGGGGLPGKPDIILSKYRTVIFVHGCFWHQHPGCKKSKIPAQNSLFWSKKLSRNKERDKRVRAELEKLGWKVKFLWQCEIHPSGLPGQLRNIFNRGNHEIR